MNHMSFEGRVQLLPKARDKLQTSVREDGLRYPMHTLHTSNVDLSILLNSVRGVDGYEVRRFGESIHDHPNRIKLVGDHW
jgi:hypothetical protein